MTVLFGYMKHLVARTLKLNHNSLVYGSAFVQIRRQKLSPPTGQQLAALLA